MKINHRNLTQILLITGVLVMILCTCTQDEYQNNPKGTISIDNSSIKPYQLVIVKFEGDSLKNDIYTGVFGTTKLTLKKSSSNQLVFVVPNVSPGEYLFSLDIATKYLYLKVLESDTIANPTIYVSNLVKESMLSYNSLLNDTSYQESIETKNTIANMNQALSDFEKLPDNDKKQIAIFLNNNKYLIDSLKTALNTYLSIRKNIRNIYRTEYTANSDIRQLERNIVLMNTIIGVIAAASVMSFGIPIACVSLGITTGLVLHKIYYGHLTEPIEHAKVCIREWMFNPFIPQLKFIDITWDFIEKKFINPLKNPNEVKGYYQIQSAPTIQINSKELIQFDIMHSYRTLEKSDITSSNSTVSTFLQIYEKLNVIWSTFFSSKYGQLPGYIQKTGQKYVDKLSQIKIIITDNANNVSVSELKGTASNFTTTFTTSQSTKQTFKFKIQITDMDVVAEQEIAAELITSEPYTIEKVSGDNQTSELGKTLTDPIKVIVKDINGNPFPGAKVNFAANNGGSVSQSQVNTEMDGTASVTWKINTSDLTQTLNVTCFKGDGSQVINSPVSFTAIFKQPYSIEKVSGDNQTGELGKTLTDPIKVIVKDINGNPFAGAKVNFEANNGGSVSQTQVQTGTDGTASITWKINTSDLTQTLNVTCFKGDGSQVINSPVTFTAIYKQPYSIEKKSGDNQTGELGKTLKEPIKVIVKDGNENPFPGAKVNFAANNGGSVSQSQVITGVDGIASVTWTLGSSDLTQKVNVTSFLGDNKTPLQGSPLVLTATINLDPEPISIEKVSGDNQKGEFGKPLPSPIIGKLKDQFGNPFKNGNVIFEVQNGGSVSFTQAITGIDGTFSTIWTLGTIDTNQSIIVKAFRIDGTSALKGSPLIFNASAFPCNTTEDINILNGYEWDVTPHNPVRPWNKLSGYVNILRQAGNAPGASKDYTVYCNKNIKYIYMRYTSASGNLLETWTKEIVNLTSSSLILKNTSSSVIETWYPFK